MAFLIPYASRTTCRNKLQSLTFDSRHYYRRRYNPEINLEDIQSAKSHIEPILTRLREVDNCLRAIITRVSRNYNIPVPGSGMGLSTITSPSSPTGDLTRDSARLLLLYLRTVLSKAYFREVDRTLTKVEKFERSYWDEDEGEQNNTGFWKRLELGNEELEEGIGYVKKWRDGKARENEWWPKIKEMEDAIREGTRWEQDVVSRRTSIGSNPSVNGGVNGGINGSVNGGINGSMNGFEPPLRGLRMSLIGAKHATRGSIGTSSSTGSAVDSVMEDSEGERDLARRRGRWRRTMDIQRRTEVEPHLPS